MLIFPICFPPSKYADFVQAASAFREARTLSHSLLLSFRKDLQAWDFSQHPFPHCLCWSLGGLLDVGCSAGNVFLSHSSRVVSVWWVWLLGLAFLLQVSQEAQGWKGLQKSLREVARMRCACGVKNAGNLLLFSLCNSGPSPICCYINRSLRRLLVSDLMCHLDGTAFWSTSVPAWLVLDKVLVTVIGSVCG